MQVFKYWTCRVLVDNTYGHGLIKYLVMQYISHVPSYSNWSLREWLTRPRILPVVYCIAIRLWPENVYSESYYPTTTQQLTSIRDSKVGPQTYLKTYGDLLLFSGQAVLFPLRPIFDNVLKIYGEREKFPTF